MKQVFTFVQQTRLKMNKGKISREKRMAALEVGEIICFPITIYPSIRTQVARIRVTKNISLKATLNKELGRVEVTRIS